MALAKPCAVVRVQPERVHRQGLSDKAPVEVAMPDAFQLPPERRPIPRTVAEDLATPTLLAAMQLAAKPDGSRFADHPMGRWAQPLLREASRVIRDRRALGGGGGALADESHDMRLLTLARGLECKDGHVLSQLRRRWPEFRDIVRQASDGYELIDAAQLAEAMRWGRAARGRRRRRRERERRPMTASMLRGHRWPWHALSETIGCRSSCGGRHGGGG